MRGLYWLTDDQIERLRAFFPKIHSKLRVDGHHVLSGIIFVNRNGLCWRDASREYGSHKTLYNRWKRWGSMGVFIPDDGCSGRWKGRDLDHHDRDDLFQSTSHGFKPTGKKRIQAG